jgi:hypothetical protein
MPVVIRLSPMSKLRASGRSSALYADVDVVRDGSKGDVVRSMRRLCICYQCFVIAVLLVLLATPGLSPLPNLIALIIKPIRP